MPIDTHQKSRDQKAPIPFDEAVRRLLKAPPDHKTQQNRKPKEPKK